MDFSIAAPARRFVTLHVTMVCLLAFPFAAALRVVWRNN